MNSFYKRYSLLFLLFCCSQFIYSQCVNTGVNLDAGNTQGFCAPTEINLTTLWPDSNNVSTEYINIAGSNPNSDDGNLNFDQGEVINATQKFYTEVIGDANGVGVNLSLTGSYNPVNDLSLIHI